MCLFLVSVTVMLSISCFDILFSDHIEAPRLIAHDNSTKKFFSFSPWTWDIRIDIKLPLFLVTRQNLWHHLFFPSSHNFSWSLCHNFSVYILVPLPSLTHLIICHCSQLLHIFHSPICQTFTSFITFYFFPAPVCLSCHSKTLAFFIASAP
jgi:hypothetical protein